MRKSSRGLIVYGVEKLNTILLANNSNQCVSRYCGIQLLVYII